METLIIGELYGGRDYREQTEGTGLFERIVHDGF